MVLAPTVDLAAVSLRKPMLNSNARNGAKVPRGCEASWERLETATPATTPALPLEHSATRLLNKLGNYHCNNRVYSISHGRWLSPDQAANPAYNLFDYALGKATRAADPAGLKICVASDLTDEKKDALKKRMTRMCIGMKDHIKEETKGGMTCFTSDYCEQKKTDYVDLTPDQCGAKSIVYTDELAYKDFVGCTLICELMADEQVFEIRFGGSASFNPHKKDKDQQAPDQNKPAGGHIIVTDPKSDGNEGVGDFWGEGDVGKPTLKTSFARQLAHELAHAYRWMKRKGVYGKGCTNTPEEEVGADQIENAVAKEIAKNDAELKENHGIDVNKDHWGGTESGRRKTGVGQKTKGADVPEGLPSGWNE